MNKDIETLDWNQRTATANLQVRRGVGIAFVTSVSLVVAALAIGAWIAFVDGPSPAYCTLGGTQCIEKTAIVDELQRMYQARIQ